MGSWRVQDPSLPFECVKLDLIGFFLGYYLRQGLGSCISCWIYPEASKEHKPGIHMYPPAILFLFVFFLFYMEP